MMRFDNLNIEFPAKHLRALASQSKKRVYTYAEIRRENNRQNFGSPLNYFLLFS